MTDTGASLPHGPLDPFGKAQIRELLRLHLPPPPDLLPTLSELADELGRCDVEIARLREKLNELVVKRANIQAHYTDGIGLFAPIRRLPSEILVEILRLCWDSFTPAVEDLDANSISLPTEIARLAHSPLLTLSRVCARWHSIALGTPALWDQIDLEGILWTAPLLLDKIMQLLRSALDRSANHSLAVTMTNDLEASPHLPALALLAQHSARWRKATFICPFSDFLMLKGNLPQLQTLQLHSWGDTPPEVDIFQDLSDLRRVEFSGTDIRLLSLLPLEQLTELRYVHSLEHKPLEIIALMPRLPEVATLHLQLSMEYGVVPIFISSITSNITALVFALSDFLPLIAQQTLGGIFAHITLPFLKYLGFGEADNLVPPSPWPHLQFLSLAERSAFHTHLETLDLCRVAITDAELLDSLAALPALKRLLISDHAQCPAEDSGEEVLITDTLLAALSLTADSCLVPQLRLLHCRSMFKFNDSTFLNCLVSRLPRAEVFLCDLWALPGHGRELDGAVLARILDLDADGELSFSLRTGREN